MVTLNEFRASRRVVFKAEENPLFAEVESHADTAYSYGDDHHKWGYIEIVPYYKIVGDSLTQVSMSLLTLGNEQWLREDTASLERMLYEYGQSDGWFEPTGKERAEQFEQALDLALGAFWDKVADCYPEAKAGDLRPDILFTFDDAARLAIDKWVKHNVK